MRFILAVVTVVLTMQAAQAASLPIKAGMSYGDARAALLAAGWEGIPGPEDSTRCSWRPGICENWPEVESCAGTGIAPCIFNFKRNDTVLTVYTVGEDVSVSSWREAKQ